MGGVGQKTSKMVTFEVKMTLVLYIKMIYYSIKYITLFLKLPPLNLSHSS